MSSSLEKRRIWEIDALRGLLILCVILAHALICAEMMFPGFTIPSALALVFQHGGTLFVILSGLSATLGSRSFRRGVIVFACALALELGSYLAVQLGFLGRSMVIRFGVLHLLGFCMMVYPLLKRFPPIVLAIVGAVIVALGDWFATFSVGVKFLYALGLTSPAFSSGDFFPIFPHLGWFCIGAALGKLCYRQRKTLMPKVNENFFLLRWFRFCGRHSLIIYLVHLPVVGGIELLIQWIIQ